MSTHCDPIEKPHTREAGCIRLPAKEQKKENSHV